MELVELKNNPRFDKCPGIYILFVEDLVYVGSSKRVFERISHHKRSLRVGKYKERPRLQKAYNKNNENNYKIKIYLCSEEDLNKYEIEFTKQYQESHKDKCVNVVLGTKHTKESIKNLKAAIKRNGGRGGENNGSHKITWKEVNEIRKSKDSNSILSKRYGLSKTSISHIKTHKTWKIKK